MHPLTPGHVNPRTANGTDANRDALSGSPRAHPVGVGVGAIGAGAAVGAAGGMIAGPLGAAAGAAIGAVVGGLAGKAAAEAVNPTVETKYWQENYPSRPYAQPNAGYDEFAPAYRYGWESVDRRGKEGQTFESVEADLQRGWEQARGTSRLAWDKAKEASRDAWNRVQRPVPVTNARDSG
jgi:hypothetical protein